MSISRHFKVQGRIKLAVLLTAVGFLLGGFGDSLWLGILQLSIYLHVIYLIVRAKSLELEEKTGIK